MATQQNSAKKPPLRQRISAWMARHGLATGIGIAVIVAAALALTLWFVVFSGLSSSADFVYSQF